MHIGFGKEDSIKIGIYKGSQCNKERMQPNSIESNSISCLKRWGESKHKWYECTICSGHPISVSLLKYFKRHE